MADDLESRVRAKFKTNYYEDAERGNKWACIIQCEFIKCAEGSAVISLSSAHGEDKEDAFYHAHKIALNRLDDLIKYYQKFSLDAFLALRAEKEEIEACH